jgi:ABC-type iron transport system FetAB permease component
MSVFERLVKKEDKILWEIYKRLFAASTPKGDFEELVANAIIDDEGRRHIPFMDYVIEQDVMDNIIETVLKENRVRKDQRGKYKTSVYLGCSPKSYLKME